MWHGVIALRVTQETYHVHPWQKMPERAERLQKLQIPTTIILVVIIVTIAPAFC